MNLPFKRLFRLSSVALVLTLLGGCATMSADAPAGASSVVSRSDALQLTAADYKAILASQPRDVLEANAGSPDRMREMVLDLHSDAALAEQAIAEGLDKDPVTAARLAEARRKILATSLMLQVRDNAEVPTDLSALTQERYLREKPKLKTLEERKVAHILLTKMQGCPCKVEPLGKRAKELHKELLVGADFAEAARKYSMDTGSAEAGGVLPDPVRRDGKTVEDFESAVFKLEKPGDISEPLVTMYGIHLIKLLDIKPGRQLSYEEVEASLQGRVIGELRFGAMERRRGNAYPDPDNIDYKALEAVIRELLKSNEPSAKPEPAAGEPTPAKALGVESATKGETPMAQPDNAEPTKSEPKAGAQ